MLSNRNDRWLMVRSGIDRAESVGACRKTGSYISCENTPFSDIIQSLVGLIIKTSDSFVIIYTLKKAKVFGLVGRV